MQFSRMQSFRMDNECFCKAKISSDIEIIKLPGEKNQAVLFHQTSEIIPFQADQQFFRSARVPDH